MTETRVSVWPVLLLAAPAGVAIWSGWVGLGELAGFGMVRPLPGIADGFELNTAITLPIGMECYAAYALRVWLSGAMPEGARTFARRSAIGALVLGALGQVAYHLLAAAGVTSAPWPVTALVACLPVAVLGMGAALAHLIRAEQRDRAEADLELADARAVRVAAGRELEDASRMRADATGAREAAAAELAVVEQSRRDTEQNRTATRTAGAPTPHGALRTASGGGSDRDLNRARTVRARYAAEGKRCGYVVLERELGVPQRAARRLARELDTEQPLRLVAGREQA